MSDYQTRFDSLLAEANSAVANNTTAIREHIPSLNPNHVRRLLSHMSKMLGIIDKGSAQNPEYLAGSPTIYPERAIEVASRIRNSFENGVDQFLQDILPFLVEIDSRLTRAVGVKAYSINEVKNAQIRQMDQYLDWMKNRYSNAGELRDGIKEKSDEVQTLVARMEQLSSGSQQDLERVASIKAQAEKLSSGNANQNPLEKLVREARSKIEEIEQISARAKDHEDRSERSLSIAQRSATESANVLKSLEESDTKADEILRNATQAGLAGAYKTERDHLSREQNMFASGFYAIILLVIIYAAVFLLPIFRQIILNENGSQSAADSALLLLVRLAILSPVVWALIFTNRRFHYLETLQMDYAAKASTALAYSGYIDEMESDPELSKRLKDGLVVRFLEHPSRLLGKKHELDISRTGPDGPIVTSKTASDRSSLDGSLEE